MSDNLIVTNVDLKDKTVTIGQNCYANNRSVAIGSNNIVNGAMPVVLGYIWSTGRHKPEITKKAKRFWCRYLKHKGVKFPDFLKEAKKVYKEEKDISRRNACIKARTVVLFDTQLDNILK